MLNYVTKEPDIWRGRSNPFELPYQTTKKPASGTTTVTIIMIIMGNNAKVVTHCHRPSIMHQLPHLQGPRLQGKQFITKTYRK
jgi:hypothetical protein